MKTRWMPHVALAIIAAFGITACGSDPDEGTTPDEPVVTDLPTDTGAVRTTDAPTETTDTANADSEAPTVEYDGPEAGLPNDYGTVDTAPEGCVIGYLDLTAAQQSLKAEEDGAVAEAERISCEIKVLDDELNPTKQVNNFDTMLAQDVSAIVLYPMVPESMQPSVDQAAAKGIPVIAIQTPVSADQEAPDGYSTSVLQGFDTAAYLRAKAVAEARPGAKFVIQGLALPVAALQNFAERQKYWAEQFGLEFLGQDDIQGDSADAAVASMTAILAKYPDVEAVFSFNDDSAAADASVLASNGNDDVLVLGFNGQESAFQGIREGTIFGTYQPAYLTVGALTVDAAVQLIADPATELPRIVVVPGTLVTAENVDTATPLGQ